MDEEHLVVNGILNGGKYYPESIIEENGWITIAEFSTAKEAVDFAKKLAASKGNKNEQENE